MSKFSWFGRFSVGLAVLGLLAGCGGTSPSSPSETAISVSISPGAAVSMVDGATQTFTATVTGDPSNAGVSWTASVGSINNGVYTAPTPVGTSSATVTATSKTDPTKSASVTIPLTAIAVSIGPTAPAEMEGGATQSFTATVLNDGAGGGVSWTVTGGGGFSTNSTASGAATTYTAASPIAVTAAIVTATSKTDPSKTASVVVPLAPISVGVISPSTVSLAVGASHSFSVAVANDPTNSGVTWSVGSGPGTLTAAGPGSVTYNAPASALAGNATVTLTATSVKDPTKSSSAAITLNAISVAIVPTNPTSMAGGSTQAFAATVANDTANAGVTWTVSGGGSLSLAATASGSPTVYTAPALISASSATITAASKTDPTKSATVTIPLSAVALTLTSPAAITLDAAQTYTIGASITGDTSGSGATFAVSGAGGTLSASPVSGNTPSSIYTAPVVTTASASTITVASVKDPSRVATVAVTLNPAMSFTTPGGALASATAGTAYTGATLAVSGGSGTKTFSVTSGALPAGLTLSASGVISGTPTGPGGTANFTVHVVDQSSDPVGINQAFSIAVSAAPLAWTSPAATLTYTVGTAISPLSLSTSGGTGTVTYSLNSGTLPAGLQIAGGQLTGTPTAPTTSSGNVVTFLATDSSTPTAETAVSPSITLIANPVPLTITSSALAVGDVGVPYSYQLLSSGGTGAITWSLASGSLAGTGLSLSSTGLLSGTPTAMESGLSLIFQARDSATNQQQTKTAALPLSVLNPLSITTSPSLPIATLNALYSQTLAASGGSGSGYTWTVTSGASSLSALNLSLSPAGVITGTPTSTGVAGFVVQVTDSSSNTASAAFTVSTSTALALPAPNPSTLGQGNTNLVYSGYILVAGGNAGYTWTVNGSAVPTSGAPVALADGLSISNAGGGAALSISGQPSATGTVTFTASVKDSSGTVVGPYTYTIQVTNLFTVGGQINSQVGCSTGGLTGVTVTINTNPVQTTTTSANGAFSFSNVPAGTYTITPSISGTSVAFYPATETVTVTSSNTTATNITATLGYSVTGTVAYSGSQSGQIYLALNPTGSCGGRSPGTSVSAPGTFQIRGVPPGTYTMQAFMDNVGDAVPNASNPVGSTTGVSVSTQDVQGVAVTLADPAAVTLTTAPTLTNVSPFNSGVMAQYKPITNSSGLETATYYTFQWSTSPTFATITGSKRFTANGTHSNLWFLHGLTNGGIYYFRAYGTSGGTNEGPASAIFGPVTISAPTVGNVVTGTVSFAATATGPLYVGFYDQGSSAFYGQYFASPVSPQTYTVQVPTGSDYLFLGLVDQNNDGAIDTNDITNTGNGTSQPVTVISANTSNENLTLPSTNGIASVTTENFETTGPGGTNQNYTINFQVNGLIKQPVAAALVSGSNLITPVDIAICGGPGSTCNQGFQISFNLYGTSPAVGDSYLFDVTYSDGTTGTLTAAVTAVLNAFATGLSPQTGTSSSITPTFNWTDPTNPSAYSYQFYLIDPSGAAIWQVPATSAASNGFSSAITSIAWGVDPTGGSSNPTVSSLTLGATYLWQITAQDSNGNTAVTQVQYQP
jgi:hypothetical protein